MRRADLRSRCSGLIRPESLADDGGRHATVFQHAGDTAHRVGAAAEAEQVDAVARLPDADDLGIAVDDVLRDAEAGRLTQEVVDAAPPLDPDADVGRARAKAAIVEGDLPARVDRGVRRDAGGAKQLVDVAARLVGHVAARLAGAVREDENILSHSRSQWRMPSRHRHCGAVLASNCADSSFHVDENWPHTARPRALPSTSGSRLWLALHINKQSTPP